tara:strand:+ start:9049 stop:10299 length:1251 start_codon:yes stop_codon:yes gene_type:complete
MNNRFCNGDYYQHVVNKPDNINISKDFSNILIINSEDRDRYLYPNSNNYVINLNKTYSDVVEIELISIDYNYCRNTFDETNNNINISIDDELYKYDMPIGEYKSIDNIIDTFNTITKNSKDLEGRNTNISIELYNNLDKTYFIFENIETIPLCQILFKGDEKINNRIQRITSNSNTNKPELNTTYYKSINDISTNTFKYKQNTDGRMIGFSENDFSNKISLVQITQITQTLASIDNYHTISLAFTDNHECDRFYTLINIPNIKLEILGKDIGNIFGFSKKDSRNIQINNTVQLSNDALTNVITDIKSNIILSDISYNLKRDHTIYLDIKDLDRLNSNNKNIDNTFAAIPVNMDNKIYFDNTKTYGTIKYFNPVKRNLDKLEICFKDKNGNILQHNGKENCIVFAIKCLNDSNTIRN